MYFFKRGGKQGLDCRGDLILTHNDALIKGRVKSAAPARVQNAKRVENIAAMGFVGKFKTTVAAIRFIWGESQALTAEVIDKEGL